MNNQIDEKTATDALKDSVDRARQLIREAKQVLAGSVPAQGHAEGPSIDFGAMQADAGVAGCSQQGFE